jgi:hypothetical protein
MATREFYATRAEGLQVRHADDARRRRAVEMDGLMRASTRRSERLARVVLAGLRRRLLPLLRRRARHDRSQSAGKRKRATKKAK